MSRFWSQTVHQLTPYTPGEQPKIDDLIKLNTNENPYGPSPKVIEAINQANTEQLRKYPDPSADRLKRAIAEFYSSHGIKKEQVFVGNSSDEVLGHVFKALLKQDLPILFPDITYSFYPVYCGLFDIEFNTIPLRENFELAVQDYQQANGGIIFANPNAPTGLAITTSQIEMLLQSSPDSVVVVDEAYIDFATGSVRSAIELVNTHPNLVVTQTLSKSRSLAGMRVGLAIANEDLIAGLERVKNSFHPYALDTIGISAAVAAFEDRDYFNNTCKRVIETREQFSHSLTSMGFNVLVSHTNFVFASHPQAPAQELFTHLRANKIIVRYFDKPRLRGYLRISIGTEQEMNTCSNVIKGFIEKHTVA